MLSIDDVAESPIQGQLGPDTNGAATNGKEEVYRGSECSLPAHDLS